nr:DnaD domain protein [Paenibacillus phytohabitans]
MSSHISDQVTERETGLPEEGSVSTKNSDSAPDNDVGVQKGKVTSSQKRNSSVPIKGTVIRKYPSHIKGFIVSKTSIKTNLKRIKRTTRTRTDIEVSKNKEYSFQSIIRDYENNFTASRDITPFEEEDLQTLFDDYGGEWFHFALREAYRLGTEKRNLAYVRGILRGYRERGGMDKRESRKHSDASEATVTPRNYNKPQYQRGSKRKPKIPILLDNGSGYIPTPVEMAEMMRKAQEIKESKALERAVVSHR